MLVEVGVSAGASVAVAVGMSVGVLVGVFVLVRVGVFVGVLVLVRVGVLVGVLVLVRVDVLVDVGVLVRVGVFVDVGVFVGVLVAVGVALGIGVWVPEPQRSGIWLHTRTVDMKPGQRLSGSGQQVNTSSQVDWPPIRALHAQSGKPGALDEQRKAALGQRTQHAAPVSSGDVWTQACAPNPCELALMSQRQPGPWWFGPQGRSHISPPQRRPSQQSPRVLT